MRQFIRDLRTIVIGRKVEGENLRASNLKEAKTRIALSFSHSFLYPWHDGIPRRDDPTYGKIDRDIQWFVNDIYRPGTIAQRAALESNFQRDRDEKKTAPTY